MSAFPARVIPRQRVLARIAYWCSWPWRGIGRRTEWIVGVEEIAGMVAHIGQALPGSLTVVHRPHRFYDARFDVVIQKDDSRWESLRRLYGGPLVLGWMLARTRGVVYVGAAGFLGGPDEREWEFSFIRRHRRAIVCIFTGNDIRSPELMSRWAVQTGHANIGSILRLQGAPFSDAAYEEQRRLRARTADRWANAVVTAAVDQLSYLERPTEAFLYFYPDDRFAQADAKFDALDEIVVVHAPSNPTLKGTDAVRAAMTLITDRHPSVVYRELTDVSNDKVLAALDGAHIVVNQLHAQMPGVFGIEAMARDCVMVCSADPAIETDLVGAEGAWVIATTDDLVEQLERLVSEPAGLRAQAQRGHRWARDHASSSASGVELARILDAATTDARRQAPTVRGR